MPSAQGQQKPRLPPQHLEVAARTGPPGGLGWVSPLGPVVAVTPPNHKPPAWRTHNSLQPQMSWSFQSSRAHLCQPRGASCRACPRVHPAVGDGTDLSEAVPPTAVVGMGKQNKIRPQLKEVVEPLSELTGCDCLAPG